MAYTDYEIQKKLSRVMNEVMGIMLKRQGTRKARARFRQNRYNDVWNSMQKSVNEGTLQRFLTNNSIYVPIPTDVRDYLREKEAEKYRKDSEELVREIETRRIKKNASISTTNQNKEIGLKEISFDSFNNTLFICNGTIRCRRKKHTIVPATGILADIKGKIIYINVNYCTICKKYFIAYNEYLDYRDKYGALLGNFRFENTENKSSTGMYKNLSAHSILNLVGYSVNQSDDYTASERHTILANIMDRNIASKSQIIDYLHFFINNSSNRKNMDIANSKWQDDLEWTRSYKINQQRKFIVKSIKR